MARCPYLDYEGPGLFYTGDGEYICQKCDKHMDFDDKHVKYVCDAEYGDKYKDCPVYKNS